ncbi:MAG: insulinase family protein [Candidatus Aenigmarchaeota archaeon]|nr:insulinase family protein [Candidatus Aenigmarchaeota archaeon]
MAVLNGNCREFQLDNGLIVALQETPTETVYGRLRIDHGAIHEREGEEGIAHFLEHCLMTGGSAKYSPADVEKIRGNIGYGNATTTLEKTEIPFDLLADDLELYLDFVSDAAFSPLLDADTMNQERVRVLREIADDKSNPDFKDNRDFKEALVGAGPHTYYVAGKDEIIKRAAPDDLRGFHSRGYFANNMNLVLVGGLPADIDKIVRKYFERRPSGKVERFVFPRPKPLHEPVVICRHAPELLNREKPEESTAFLKIAMHGPRYAEGDRFPVQILAEILGRAGTSRLHKAVSENRGLAYGIGCGYEIGHNQGNIYVMGGIASKGLDEAAGIIFGEFRKLQGQLACSDELESTKRVIRYRVAKTAESNQGHAFRIETKMEYGETADMYSAGIAAVTPEMVRDAAKKYLPASRENGRYVMLIRDPLK